MGRQHRQHRLTDGQSEFTAQGIRVQFAGETLDGPTRWSFAEDHHVIVVHRAGELQRLATEFADGLRTEILPRAGDCWIIPAGLDYAALAVGNRVEYCELHLPVNAIGHEVHAAAGKRDPFLHHAVEQLAAIAGDTDDLAGLLREAVLQGIRLHLRRGVQDATSADHPDPDLMARLEAYLRDNLARRHSLADMARFAGIAPSTLIRQFRRSFGKTPYRWLLEERIDRARELLLRTGLSVTEIALETGFSTPAHFSSQFRRMTGWSPREFRAMDRR